MTHGAGTDVHDPHLAVACQEQAGFAQNRGGSRLSHPTSSQRNAPNERSRILGPGAAMSKSIMAVGRPSTRTVLSGFANAIAVSPNGVMVFVTGDSDGLSGYKDYATIAYDAATGRRLWLSRWNGPDNGPDVATSIGVSPDGVRVVVTGSSGFSSDVPLVLRTWSGPQRAADEEVEQREQYGSPSGRGERMLPATRPSGGSGILNPSPSRTA